MSLSLTADEGNQAKTAQATMEACDLLVLKLEALAKSFAFQGNTLITWKLVQKAHAIESLQREIERLCFR